MISSGDRLEAIDQALRVALGKLALDEIDSLLRDREAVVRELVSDTTPGPSWLAAALHRQEQLAAAFEETRDRLAASLKEARDRRSAVGGWRDADRPDARFLSEKV